MALLEVDNISVNYEVRGSRRTLRAVDGVSFALEQGEAVGLVGESGCGKTTVGHAITGTAPLSGGSVRFKGAEVASLRGRALTRFRRDVQMIFQDPFGSLNPRMTAGAALAEVLQVHGIDNKAGQREAPSKAQRAAATAALLERVGLDPAYACRYPHELSGGQRQRVGIARALAVGPMLIVADEPVSALDVSVQAQIMNLLKDLQPRMGLTYLLVAHDLAVVRYMCSRILVMYLGRIVESAPSDVLLAGPGHPYTEALLSAAPDVAKGLSARKQGTRRIVLSGEVPSPLEKLTGCPFQPRCHRAESACRTQEPSAKRLGPNHLSVCHFAERVGRVSSGDAPTGTAQGSRE